MFKSMNKKGLDPLVATSLLLIVAVVSVISFENWFATYQSQVFLSSESQSNIDNLNIGIETLIDDTLYLKAGDGLEVTSVKIENITCNNLNGTYTGMSRLNVSNCISGVEVEIAEIVVYTRDRIFSEEIYRPITSTQEDSTPTLSCSPVICTDNILFDSGNNLYWTRNLSQIQVFWANGDYPEPTWNPSTSSYDYGAYNKSDYPAFEFCDDLVYDEINDWRIPNITEFEDLGTSVGGWGSTNFENYGFQEFTEWFWTSDEFDSTRANSFSLISGSIYGPGYGKSNNGFIACVRED